MMTAFLQSLIDAVSNGAVYGLAALGLGLVFGVMRLVNFAHGELITASAYTLVLTWQLGWIVAILLSILVALALATLMDQAVFRHIRTVTPATMLIISFGVSFLLQYVYSLVFGTTVRAAPVGAALATSVTIGPLRFRLISAVAIGLAVVLAGALALVLSRTSIGLQVQAASTDMRTARLLGIRANRVIVVTFAMSGVLAAAAAFLLTVQSGAVGPTFGVNVTIMALMGAVIGGIGSLPGSVLGGFVVGFALSALTSALPTSFVTFRDAFVVLIVLVLLLVKPSGILAGRGTGERT